MLTAPYHLRLLHPSRKTSEVSHPPHLLVGPNFECHSCPALHLVTLCPSLSLADSCSRLAVIFHIRNVWKHSRHPPPPHTHTHLSQITSGNSLSVLQICFFLNLRQVKEISFVEDGGKKVRVHTSLAPPEGFSPPWAIIQNVNRLFVWNLVLSGFRIAKEAWCFDSNLGIKQNYENRPMCPEGTYFPRKGRGDRKNMYVTECAHTPAALYTYIRKDSFLFLPCVSFFFLWFFMKMEEQCSRS